jgi:hypothetical protein
MTTWYARAIAAGTLAYGSAVCAQQTFTPKTIVQFAPGGERERALFARLPGMADIVRGRFGIGAADLNGDGSDEMILVSLVCDDAGCPVVALQSGGPAGITQLFADRVGGRLAITNETIDGYHAFAAADRAGAIMIDARTGRQIVYPVGPATEAAPPAP